MYAPSCDRGLDYIITHIYFYWDCLLFGLQITQAHDQTDTGILKTLSTKNSRTFYLEAVIN